MINEINRRKTHDQLRGQTAAVSAILGADIVPPSYGERVYSMDMAALRNVFPVRSDIYTGTLRSQVGAAEVTVLRQRYPATKLKIMNGLDRSITRLRTADDPDWHERQIESLELLLDKMEKGEVQDRGHFDQATRFGKTKIFSEIIATSGQKTLIVVPKIIPGDQAYEELTKAVNAVDVGKRYGGKKEDGRQVEIVTYDGLLRRIGAENPKDRIKPEDYGLLILDEVHWGLTPRRMEIIEMFTNALKLGFTASPRYDQKKQVANFLPPLIDRVPIKEATEIGRLCPHTNYVADTQADLSNVRVTVNGDYNDTELSRAVNTEKRNQAVVNVYKRKKFNGLPSLAFCADRAHTEALAEQFRANGIEAEAIHGGLSRTDQRDIRTRFRKGETKVMCTADLLVESVTEPSATVCLNARPTLSVVRATQRGGRVLGQDENNPDKHAYIIDFIDSDRRGRRAVRFADVENEKVYGIVVDPFVADSPGRQDLQITVTGMNVRVDLQEILSIFDELVTDDTSGNISMTTKALVGILKQNPHSIAERIQSYFKGSLRRVAQVTSHVRDNLSHFSDSLEEEVELPAIVVERMLLDSIYQRMYSSEIVQEVQRIAGQVQETLDGSLDAFPALLDRVDRLTALCLQSGSEDEASHAANLCFEIGRMDVNINRAIFSSFGIVSERTSTALHNARALMEAFKNDDVQTARKTHIRRMIKTQPDLILDFINRDRESLLVPNMRHLADREQAASLIKATAAQYLMEPELPGNLLNGIRTIAESAQTLPERDALPRLSEEITRFVHEINELPDYRRRLNSEVLFERADEMVQGLLSEFTRILDADNTNIAHLGRLTAAEVNTLHNMRSIVATSVNNARIVHEEIVNALGEDPGMIEEFIGAHQHGAGMEESRLTDAVRGNSHLIR